MTEQFSHKGARVFVAMQKRQYHFDDGRPYSKWERVAVLRPGFAYRCSGHTESDFAVEEVSGAAFMRAKYVDEGDYAEWKERRSYIRQMLSDHSAWLLEVVSSMRDTMTCNLLTAWTPWGWRESLPDVLIGDTSWEYESGSLRAQDDLRDGKRAYVTLDGNTCWEIEEVRPPTTRGEPIRLALVRRTSFPVLGIDSVLTKDGLDFIKDEEKRREHEGTIRRIESAVVEGDSHSIRECSQVAEALLFQLGKQQVDAGLAFGQFENVVSLQHAHLEPLLQGFVGAFKDTKLVRDELKWVPGAILAVRGWGEESRHEGKDDRQLLEADGMTGVFTYAALRDFVRLCQHLHKLDPRILNPLPAQQRADKGKRPA